MSAVMSTSLNVVSIAAVRCASTSRRAIVWRRLVMRTRSSVRSPALRRCESEPARRRLRRRGCAGAVRCGLGDRVLHVLLHHAPAGA